MQAEAYVELTARYETPLFSYTARMLGGLRDGERCLIAALTAGWTELEGGGAEPARPQEWFTALVRERCFDELAHRGGVSAEDDLDGTGDCVALAADAALTALRPAHRDLLLLRDVHGLDTALVCAITDMSEADAENQLYRARAEFAAAYAALPEPDRCPLRRTDCPDCRERERLRTQPLHALLHLGPLEVRDQVREALRASLRSTS